MAMAWTAAIDRILVERSCRGRLWDRADWRVEQCGMVFLVLASNPPLSSGNRYGWGQCGGIQRVVGETAGPGAGRDRGGHQRPVAQSEWMQSLMVSDFTIQQPVLASGNSRIPR